MKIVFKDPLALWFEALDNVNIFTLDFDQQNVECVNIVNEL